MNEITHIKIVKRYKVDDGWVYVSFEDHSRDYVFSINEWCKLGQPIPGNGLVFIIQSLSEKAIGEVEE